MRGVRLREMGEPRKPSPLTNVEKKYLDSQQVARLWRKDFYREQDGRIVDFGSQLREISDPDTNLMRA
jgi:hypothetical protein